MINFPLPPSVNETLLPVAGALSISKTGKMYCKGRFVKTETYRAFERRALEWSLLHKAAFDQIKEDLQGMVRASSAGGKRFGFRVDCFFAFEESRLWTVNNLPKRLDSDNRLKPVRDALASLLDIDDKYFFSGFFEKLSAQSQTEECSYIRITPMAPRTLQDLRMDIQRERRATVRDEG